MNQADNKILKITWISLLLAILTGCTTLSGPTNPSQPLPTHEVPLQKTMSQTEIPSPTVHPTDPMDNFAFEQNRRLGRGVNLGNILEAPQEGDWGLTLEEKYFDLIKGAGFDSVRIPIRWTSHTSQEPPYTIDPQFFERIDWAILQALDRDLAVVINVHHYEEIHESPRLHKERFLAIWEQIATRYKDLPESVYFELLNEPMGTLAATSWNEFAAEAIKVVRTSTPHRTLIVGPGNWNAIDALPGLFLPEEDRNLIVTFHYYLPFQFTHQGAEWVDNSEPWLGTTWDATREEKEMITRSFESAVEWANKNRRPLYLGEFGAYSKADMDSRARWTEFIARTAEERDISWAYWEFGSGFGVFNPSSGKWYEPLRYALFPNQ
jgi:endoglucanase